MNPITDRPVAHESDHRPPGGVLNHRLEALAHHLLKRHPLPDHRVAAIARQKCLLHPRKSATEHADDQVVLVVGLGLRGSDPVVILEQRDHAVGDLGQHDPVLMAESVLAELLCVFS